MTQTSTDTSVSPQIIPDLDKFFNDVYFYYRKGGYNQISQQSCLQVLMLTMTIGFVMFLWTLVALKMKIGQFESGLSEVDLKVLAGEEKGVPEGMKVILGVLVGIRNFPVFYFGMYFIPMLILLLIQNLKKNIQLVRKHKKMQKFYAKTLKIFNCDLNHTSWNFIMDRLITYQNKVQYCRVKKTLTKHDIISRIMRVDNFIISLINSGLIDFHVSVDTRWFHFKKRFYNKSIDWCLRSVMLDSMFVDQSPNINPSFFDEAAQQRSMRKFFCQSLVMGLPLFVVRLVYLLINHLANSSIFPVAKPCCGPHAIADPAQMRVNRRTTNSYTFWKLREFNELPHQLDERLYHTKQHILKMVEYLSMSSLTTKSYWSKIVLIVLTYTIAVLIFLPQIPYSLYLIIAIIILLRYIKKIQTTNQATIHHLNPTALNTHLLSELEKMHSTSHWILTDMPLTNYRQNSNDTTPDFLSQWQSYFTTPNRTTHKHAPPYSSFSQSIQYSYSQNGSQDTSTLSDLYTFKKLKQTLLEEYTCIKFYHIFEEAVSFFLIPFFCHFKLKPRVNEILQHFKDTKTSVKGLGDVSIYSTLDLQKYGHPLIKKAFTQQNEGTQGIELRLNRSSSDQETVTVNDLIDTGHFGDVATGSRSPKGDDPEREHPLEEIKQPSTPSIPRSSTPELSEPHATFFDKSEGDGLRCEEVSTPPESAGGGQDNGMEQSEYDSMRSANMEYDEFYKTQNLLNQSLRFERSIISFINRNQFYPNWRENKEVLDLVNFLLRYEDDLVAGESGLSGLGGIAPQQDSEENRSLSSIADLDLMGERFSETIPQKTYKLLTFYIDNHKPGFLLRRGEGPELLLNEVTETTSLISNDSIDSADLPK